MLPLRLSVASPMPTVGSCQRSDAFSHAHCFLPMAYALSYYIGMFEFGIRFPGRG